MSPVHSIVAMNRTALSKHGMKRALFLMLLLSVHNTISPPREVPGRNPNFFSQQVPSTCTWVQQAGNDARNKQESSNHEHDPSERFDQGIPPQPA
jgi:hypothetical protein